MSAVTEQVLGGSARPGALLEAVRAVGPAADGAAVDLLQRSRAQLAGAGAALQPLLDEPEVTDVLVNGSEGVWVDRGAGLVRAPARIGSARDLAMRLAALAGRRLDDASPIVDGRLPDGTRLHAVLSPLVAGDAHISLRTSRRRAFTWAELLRLGFLDQPAADVLDGLLAIRANVLVSGATGTGKTTLAAAALSRVDPRERIVIIEEAAELSPAHPHVVHLQSRGANVQGVGGVGLDVLVRAAMRMRPDRLVLGECRGAEVRDVLSALNTGHEGGWATVHANAVVDVPARLVALGALAGMDALTVAAQAAAAIDAVLHLRRGPDGVRRLAEIGTVCLDEHGRLRAVLAASAGAPGGLEPGPGWEGLAARLDRGSP